MMGIEPEGYRGCRHAFRRLSTASFGPCPDHLDRRIVGVHRSSKVEMPLGAGELAEVEACKSQRHVYPGVVWVEDESILGQPQGFQLVFVVSSMGPHSAVERPVHGDVSQT